MLRDAQVLSIWEGTTNILSLDVLRCVSRSSGLVLQAYVTYIQILLASASLSVRSVDRTFSGLREFLQASALKPPGAGHTAWHASIWVLCSLTMPHGRELLTLTSMLLSGGVSRTCGQ